jgi:hypothetical protein
MGCEYIGETDNVVAGWERIGQGGKYREREWMRRIRKSSWGENHGI